MLLTCKTELYNAIFSSPLFWHTEELRHSPQDAVHPQANRLQLDITDELNSFVSDEINEKKISKQMAILKMCITTLS